MKVLFITKQFKIEPLGIMSLSAVAKKAGHEVRLITIEQGIYGELASYKPDVVAYSVMTGDQDYFEAINKQIKDAIPGIQSIAGGPHPTFFPEWKSSIDHYCVGEGEGSFVEFLDHIDDFKGEQSVINFGPRPLIRDLDSLPFPDRDLVFQFPEIKNGPIKHFMAGRGCPFLCSYCFNEAYSKIYDGQPRVRLRSVDNMIEEIKQVLQQSPETKFIYFQDDTFILYKDWIEEFALKYKTNIGLPFHCHTRANLVNIDVAKMLHYAGCYSVHIAAEAGNQDVREKILNRKMSNETIKNAVEYFEGLTDIRVMLQNMIGLPGTTLENDYETLELNIQCNPTYSWVSIFQPYPKTELGKYAQKIGQYKGDFSNLKNNFFDSSPLDIPHANEVANLQKLFAFAVKNPDIYRSGLLDTLIRVPAAEVKDKYTKIYTDLRNKSDQELYGMKI